VSDLELGTRVTFSREAFRVHREDGKRFWEAPEWQEGLPQFPKAGVVVGIRQLQNGHQQYARYNANNYTMEGEDRWVVEETVKVYLVAYDLRKRPVYVFPEHVKPEVAIDD